MSRKQRQVSNIGIYHVMLRGINKQDIFFNEDDFRRMMCILRECQYFTDEQTGEITPDRCSIYAYCILHNHLHLLIREGKQPLAEVMKSIEVSYVGYYNKKYQRVGHLFQGRYESEPINDNSYFHTVLRYIAQNPVKAMESKTPEEYPYSYWNEFVGHPSNIIKVLRQSCINAVLKKYPIQDLKEWIHQYNEDKCLDMNDFYSINSDAEAWEILSDASGIENPEDFRTLDVQTQIYYLLDAIDHGINLSQASRLGTLSRYQITKAYEKKCGINQQRGLTPVLEKVWNKSGDDGVGEEKKEIALIQDNIRCIKGLGKKTYNQLHLIAEYLWDHPGSKCNEVASFLGVSNESARRQLILLVNENVVTITGNNKNRIYSLKKCGINSAKGSDPDADENVE